MAGVDSLCVLGHSKPIVESKVRATPSSKMKNMKNKPIEKIFTASGQAPSPSKDFFELVVAKDRVIWRAWRIKYKNHRMIMPTEETVNYDDFENDGRIQSDISRNLGDDVLQVALGYVSREWLARLPAPVLRNIAGCLSIKDITSLSQVCSTLRVRCLDRKLWQECYSRTFGAWDDLRERRAKKAGWRKVFIEEWERKKSNNIDWDDL